MSVPAAYIGVILIWSTTPLAIQWSGDGSGYLFGVTARMALGAIVSIGIAASFRVGVHMHRDALWTYLVAGLGIFGAMLSLYWAAQFIPSGWISVIFGLTPIVTGILASLVLGEAFGLPQITGMLTGMAGLAVIFVGPGSAESHVSWGIFGVLTSVLIHAISAIGVKRIGASLHPLATTAGGLLVAAPLFALVFQLSDNPIPSTLPTHAAASIVYLGIGGSVLGFALYYHVLHHVQATRVALITLVTPVLALAIGAWLNNEPLSPRVLAGAGIITLGLLLYQFGGKLPRRASETG